MKRSVLFLLIVVILLVSAVSVGAQNCPAPDCLPQNCPCNPVNSPCPQVPAGPFCVIYHTNNCLRSAPIDGKGYYYGDTVKVLFEPVLYKDNVWFYGWSHTPNGYANYGYNYDTFQMPAQNVDLYAICIPVYYAPAAPAEPPA